MLCVQHHPWHQVFFAFKTSKITNNGISQLTRHCSGPGKRSGSLNLIVPAEPQRPCSATLGHYVFLEITLFIVFKHIRTSSKSLSLGVQVSPSGVTHLRIASNALLQTLSMIINAGLKVAQSSRIKNDHFFSKAHHPITQPKKISKGCIGQMVVKKHPPWLVLR